MLADVFKFYFYQILNNIQLASMSASAASLRCPICLHTGVFDSAKSLRNRLVLVSTNKLTCPVCQEEIDGLDKLVLHLSSHVKLTESRKIISEESTVQGNVLLKQNTSPTHQKKSKSTVTKNKQSTASTNTPVKFVKIYPKLPVVSVNNVATRVANEDSSKTCNSIYISTAPTEASQVQSATTCDICGLQFIDANILKMHKCLIHNIEDISNQIFTRYNCHLCPKNFKMRGSLMVHLRVAHYGFKSGNNSVQSNANSDNTDAERTSNDKSLSMLKNDNKDWQCDVCRKCFTTKYFLKKHKRLHTGETPYSCAQCNKTFTFQQSYHKHLLYHNDEKPHICSFCGRAFKELSTLHNHQRIHTGEKPFSCETCGKCFRQRVSYLVHRRIHTGVMPYKCTACDKSFRYKVSQRTHKCQAQPPGTVVRQSGDLVEKLKMKHADSNVDKVELHEQIKPTAVFLEVSEANAELVRSGAKLSLEDTENENFTLIADAFSDGQKEQSEITDMENENRDNLELLNSNFDDFIDNLPEDKSVPSPSDILKKLCLSQEEDLTRSEQSNNEFVNYEMYHEFM